jgi:pantetheine-phosphate adenylyltransferase
MSHKGIFPGTFDPVTLGHLDVLSRALHLFDEVIVGVATADRHHKQTLFSAEERIDMFRSCLPLKVAKRVEVTQLEGLLVDFARQRGVHAIVRGIRFLSDYEYEFQMATMNQKLWPELDTVFLLPTEQHAIVNSSLVKEIARHGGPLDGLVTQDVGERLIQRLRGSAEAPPPVVRRRSAPARPDGRRRR